MINCSDALDAQTLSCRATLTYDVLDPNSIQDQGTSRSSCVPNFVILSSIFMTYCAASHSYTYTQFYNRRPVPLHRESTRWVCVSNGVNDHQKCEKNVAVDRERRSAASSVTSDCYQVGCQIEFTSPIYKRRLMLTAVDSDLRAQMTAKCITRPTPHECYISLA